MRQFLVLFTLLLCPLWASAATVSVHNTGVDATDSLVGAGAATAFWSLSSKPAASGIALGSAPFRYKHPAYAADTTTSAWVSPASSGSAGVGGEYVYDLTVDLTGIDPASVVITGLFSSDNNGALWLNDQAPVVTVGFAQFGAMFSFTFDSGFVSGLNVIHAMAKNEGDPTAFHVQFTSVTANPVPVPPALALMAAALAGLGALRRKRG